MTRRSLHPRYETTTGAAIPSECSERLTSTLLLVACPDCEGYGAKGNKPCKTCGGCGRVTAHNEGEA